MLVLLRNSAGRRPIAALFVLCLCLFLPGCGAKLPDRGTLPPVTAGRDTPYYLEVSRQDGPADGLAALIRENIRRSGGLKEVGSPGPGTLTVRVNVEEVFLAGPAGVGLLEGLKDTGLFLLSGILAAGIFLIAGCYGLAPDVGVALPLVVGALTGMVVGISSSVESWSNDVWAIRAGVGMAWDRTPETLEEIVVSTGRGGARSRKAAAPMLERELARRISEAITTLPPSP